MGNIKYPKSFYLEDLITYFNEAVSVEDKKPVYNLPYPLPLPVRCGEDGTPSVNAMRSATEFRYRLFANLVVPTPPLLKILAAQPDTKKHSERRERLSKLIDDAMAEIDTGKLITSLAKISSPKAKEADRISSVLSSITDKLSLIKFMIENPKEENQLQRHVDELYGYARQANVVTEKGALKAPRLSRAVSELREFQFGEVRMKDPPEYGVLLTTLELFFYISEVWRAVSSVDEKMKQQFTENLQQMTDMFMEDLNNIKQSNEKEWNELMDVGKDVDFNMRLTALKVTLSDVADVKTEEKVLREPTQENLTVISNIFMAQVYYTIRYFRILMHGIYYFLSLPSEALAIADPVVKKLSKEELITFYPNVSVNEMMQVLYDDVHMPWKRMFFVEEHVELARECNCIVSGISETNKLARLQCTMPYFLDEEAIAYCMESQ